jgi:two-component system OmpR family response regulator
VPHAACTLLNEAIVRTAWIIDDDPALHTLIGRLFRELDLEPVSFFDGAEVLTHLQQRVTVPAVINVDIMMPGMSGFALIRQLRTRLDLARVPIIIASARTEVGDAVLATKLGATLVSKPFHIQRYLATVEQLVDVSRPMPFAGVSPSR